MIMKLTHDSHGHDSHDSDSRGSDGFGRVGVRSEVDPRVDDYLEQLRSHLAGVNREDASDIIEELRSHILEKAASSDNDGGDGRSGKDAIAQVLSALGVPKDLAAQYMADNLLARASRSWSPLLLLQALLRWASLSVAGIFVLLGSVLGYGLGGSLALCGILKAIHPHTAGLWLSPNNTYSLHLGFGNSPAEGRELLGWWMIPVGLLFGGGLCLLTTQIVWWCARAYRESAGLRRGWRA